MTVGLRYRITAVLFSGFAHIAIGALFWLLPPAGAGPSLSRASGPEAVIVVQLIQSHRPANGRPSSKNAGPAPEQPTRLTGRGAPPLETVQTFQESFRAAEPAASTQADPPPDAEASAPPSVSAVNATHYQDLLLAHIGRYRRYSADARREGMEGTVWVRFLLDRNGQVLRAWVDKSSGRALLDEEAISAVRRAEPLPRIPNALPDRIDITLPIEFDLG